MTVDLLVLFLLRANAAAAVAILLVLALRRPVRALIGSSQAYWLWALAPVAAATSLFPNLKDFAPTLFPHLAGVAPTPSRRMFSVDIGIPHASDLMTCFLVGAGLMLAVFMISEIRFRRLAKAGRAGPAVVGFSWPQIVVPADYEARFTAEERRLVALHERTHIERDHPMHNRAIAAAQMLGWFNPLVHVAASCMRLDQELACDAAVLERHQVSRRLYAQTLLKAHAPGPWSAFACALADGGRHPLEIRIQALRRPPVSLRRYLAAAALVGLLGAVTALTIWTLSPQTYG